jgi:DNA-binding NarL/FixJ family response regulator
MVSEATGPVPPPRTGSAYVQEAPTMSARPTVLLCDDSRALRMLTAQQIEACGYALAGEAENGAVAVERYKALRPHVVLLDLVMPQVDGKEALRQILEVDPEARVVVLSSLGAQNDIEQCLRMGARSYLQKPIDRDTLARVLADVAA